jgi:predicted RNA methylase
LDVMRTLPDASVDAVVTDPPYGLSFMGKRWDYDVPSVEVWAECLRVLKPGGHLLAFAGTRTQHRMAVRIEDAGFEIRDLIMWCYGSGFPKSLDVSKAIDKAAGAEREVVGSRKLTGTARIRRARWRHCGRGMTLTTQARSATPGDHRPRHPRSAAMGRVGHCAKTST